jgi:protein-S-isoprenylcysteine O-methyltransferase Ste14
MTRDFIILSFNAYFAAFLLVEFVFTKYRAGAREKGDRDRRSFLFFGIVPFLGMFLWMAAINRGWVSAHPTWLLWGLGWAIGILGFAIRVTAKRTLGRFFTVRVQLQEEHKVIDAGLYRLVRHPLYLGFILEWVAPPFILGSPAGLLFTTLWIVVGVLQRIPREEELLVEGLGENYRAYMGRTKRLVPGVW